WVGVATHAGSRAAYQVGAYGYMQVHATQQAAVSGLYSLQGAYYNTQAALYLSGGGSVFYNPSVQNAALDFVGGYLSPGPPPASFPGYAGGAIGYFEQTVQGIVSGSNNK